MTSLISKYNYSKFDVLAAGVVDFNDFGVLAESRESCLACLVLFLDLLEQTASTLELLTIAKGVTIARGDGTLVQYNDLNNVPSTADFKIWDSQNKILHLHEPTIHSPANLANTSDGTAKNNCRIKHRMSGRNFVLVITVSL